jgi:hypothetical protein
MCLLNKRIQTYTTSVSSQVVILRRKIYLHVCCVVTLVKISDTEYKEKLTFFQMTCDNILFLCVADIRYSVTITFRHKPHIQIANFNCTE